MSHLPTHTHSFSTLSMFCESLSDYFIRLFLFSFSRWASVFEQLYQVVQGPAPQLTRQYNGIEFTEDFCNFVNTWWVDIDFIDIYTHSRFYDFSLIKEEMNRPKYKTLLQHPFIQLHERLQPYVHPEVASYIKNVLDSMANNGITQFTTDVAAIW
jgi:mitogen-activated protein kinase kinase 4